jgi:plasmid stabilization system protein ParE
MGQMRKAVVLQSAQIDYRKIKNYVIHKFGAQAWAAINSEWQTKINTLAVDPNLGSDISELDGTGFIGFKKYQYKNAYVIYQYSDALLTIYMFIPSMRDFRQHLMERLLSA